MGFKNWKISLKTFAASFLIALGANKVSACLKTNERLSEDFKTKCDWYYGWTDQDFNSSAINLNLPNATEAWARSKIQLDGDCPNSNDSYLTNVRTSKANHGLLEDMTARGSEVLTDQCTSIV